MVISVQTIHIYKNLQKEKRHKLCHQAILTGKFFPELNNKVGANNRGAGKFIFQNFSKLAKSKKGGS